LRIRSNSNLGLPWKKVPWKEYAGKRKSFTEKKFPRKRSLENIVGGKVSDGNSSLQNKFPC
jgi:hypothetical protein